MGGHLCSIPTVPLLQLRVWASQECVKGTQAKQSHWGLTLCSLSPKAGTAWGSPVLLAALHPAQGILWETRDSLGANPTPHLLCANAITYLSLCFLICARG